MKGNIEGNATTRMATGVRPTL